MASQTYELKNRRTHHGHGVIMQKTSISGSEDLPTFTRSK